MRRAPEADAFLRIIATADRCLLASVSLVETSVALAGRRDDARSWTERDALIAQAGMEVVARDVALVQAAQHAFLRYDKGRHPAGLTLGDCASYTLAKTRDLPLLFKGEDIPATDLAAAG